MRLVSAFEIVNHALSMGLILGMAGMSLWLWSQGQVGAGATAATAMALRLRGMSPLDHVETTSLFSVGTVQDGINTCHARSVVARTSGQHLAGAAR
jgi:ATP-binding cassette subfamily B multidrug efflux pump